MPRWSAHGGRDGLRGCGLRIVADARQFGHLSAQQRSDVSVAQVKTLLVGCQAMQSYNPELTETPTYIALDGLRGIGG
jgi:hypothetical protein